MNNDYSEQKMLYQQILLQICSAVSTDYDIQLVPLYEDNIEIQINNKANANISPGDLSIDFQKQNGSLILVARDSIDIKTKLAISSIISNILGYDMLATYNFYDFSNYDISHWCYEKEKINFNVDILREFKKLNQISHLSIRAILPDKTFG